MVRRHYQQCISVCAVVLCSWTGSNYKIIAVGIRATNLSFQSLVLAAREIIPISERNSGRYLKRSVIGTIAQASLIRNKKALTSLPRFPEKWRFHFLIKLYAFAVEAREGRCSNGGGKVHRRIYGESSSFPIAPFPFSSPNAKDDIDRWISGLFEGIDSLDNTSDCKDVAFSASSGIGASIGDPRRIVCSYRNKRARRISTIPWSDNPLSAKCCRACFSVSSLIHRWDYLPSWVPRARLQRLSKRRSYKFNTWKVDILTQILFY